MNRAISIENKNYVTKLLVYIFGKEAKVWDVNPRVIEELAKVLIENRKCRQAMNMVPRPAGLYNPKWALDQIVNISKRYVTEELKSVNENDNSIEFYNICKLSIKGKWKKHIYLVSEGLA